MKIKDVNTTTEDREAWNYQSVTEGLDRYDDNVPTEYVTITEIVVPSERDKAQLLKAFNYIHNLREIDTDFIAVNAVAHLYENPDLIKVKSS